VFKRRISDEPPVTEKTFPFPFGGTTGGQTKSLLGRRPPQSGTTDSGEPTDVPAVDSGLGVPPFRPASLQESSMIARSPFATASSTPASPAAPPGIAPSGTRPAVPSARTPARDPADRRTLVVGRGISVQGTVQDAERLVVEGTVEASMIHAQELVIAPGGVFKGEVEVEDAEISGTIDGTLTARASLTVRSTGRLLGTARCRRLQVEDGGHITGRLEMIGDVPVAKVEPARPTGEAA
jgi:cytoskeletal protein CcmA (bactofilin family)